MSFWEFACCAEGWRRSQQGEEEKIEPPTIEEFMELVDKYG